MLLMLLKIESMPLKRDDLIKRSLDARSKDIELPKVAVAATTTSPVQVEVIDTTEPRSDQDQTDNNTSTPSAPPIKGMKIKSCWNFTIEKSLEAYFNDDDKYD